MCDRRNDSPKIKALDCKQCFRLATKVSKTPPDNGAIVDALQMPVTFGRSEWEGSGSAEYSSARSTASCYVSRSANVCDVETFNLRMHSEFPSPMANNGNARSNSRIGSLENVFEAF